MGKEALSRQLASDVDIFLKRGGEVQQIAEQPPPVTLPKFYGLADWSHIYFIRSGKKGAIKIGRTAMLANRLGQLQSNNPEPLRLLGVFFGPNEMEEKLHQKFEKNRIHGEWFRPTPTLLATAELMYKMHQCGYVIPNFTVFANWLKKLKSPEFGHTIG